MKKLSKLLSGISLLVLSLPSFAAVNVNTADAEAIQSELKGVGLHKAQAIVAYREANGAFQSADELTHVKGIGLKTVEKNRANILLESPKSSD